jgi:hypothetical protein
MLFAEAILCGCNRTNPITGDWRSNVEDKDTFHFRDDGTWQLDRIVWAKGRSYPIQYRGHYTIVDTNHVAIVIEADIGTDSFTNEFYIHGGVLTIQDIDTPHTRMLDYGFVSK